MYRGADVNDIASGNTGAEVPAGNSADEPPSILPDEESKSGEASSSVLSESPKFDARDLSTPDFLEISTLAEGDSASPEAEDMDFLTPDRFDTEDKVIKRFGVFRANFSFG